MQDRKKSGNLFLKCCTQTSAFTIKYCLCHACLFLSSFSCLVIFLLFSCLWRYVNSVNMYMHYVSHCLLTCSERRQWFSGSSDHRKQWICADKRNSGQEECQPCATLWRRSGFGFSQVLCFRILMCSHFFFFCIKCARRKLSFSFNKNISMGIHISLPLNFYTDISANV